MANAADIQSASEMVKWGVNGATIFLMIIAASLAIKKNKTIILGVAILGNLIAYYFTQSPLLCMVISIACIIWVFSVKGREQIVQTKQSLKSSRPQRTSANCSDDKKMVKPGQIIGLIIGAGLILFPIIGFMIGEGSLSDPKGKMMGIGFIIFGAFMVIVNVIGLMMGTDNLLKGSMRSNSQEKESAKVESAKEESSAGKIRCRFCGKLYSSEYNGCPHCKKK